jgi:hypothetical protein
LITAIFVGSTHAYRSPKFSPVLRSGSGGRLPPDLCSVECWLGDDGEDVGIEAVFAVVGGVAGRDTGGVVGSTDGATTGGDDCVGGVGTVTVATTRLVSKRSSFRESARAAAVPRP